MTVDHILSKKTRYNGIVIDTNLLLLLFIGLFDKDQIGRYKRVIKYSREDFDKLINLINFFSDKLIITTNILTEICNLSDGFNTESEYKFYRFIEELIKLYNENLIKTIDLIRNDQVGFYKLGIADASIINLAHNNTLVVTDDLKLYHYLFSKNYDVINYNHLRTL